MEKERKKSRRRIRLNRGSTGSLQSGSEEPILSLSTFRGRDFSVFKEKSEIRCSLLQRRLSLSSEEVNKISEEITKNLLELEIFKDAQRIALYFPIKNEVRTEGIFKRAKELEKEVYFPCVEGPLLRFYKVDDLSGLKPGKFGILEPTRDSTKAEIEDLDLVIIPGIAFDRLGRRLGYGGGYYDRTIIKAKRTIGLAYGFQVLNSIPAEVDDKEVDLVVTESGIIFCKGG